MVLGVTELTNRATFLNLGRQKILNYLNNKSQIYLVYFTCVHILKDCQFHLELFKDVMYFSECQSDEFSVFISKENTVV